MFIKSQLFSIIFLFIFVSGLFAHIREQWIEKVTPDLFCVHRLENRINENVIAPFKKLRDFLMLNKGKAQRQSLTLPCVVEKLIELENFLQTTYSSENKKSFGRDLSSSQKKNVLKAWHYIESHPKININHFFTKVIGYIKCMENQLWIWGYYKFSGIYYYLLLFWFVSWSTRLERSCIKKSLKLKIFDHEICSEILWKTIKF